MDPQQQMLRITGYSDKLSVTPGEEIVFYVHCERNEFVSGRHRSANTR